MIPAEIRKGDKVRAATDGGVGSTLFTVISDAFILPVGVAIEVRSPSGYEFACLLHGLVRVEAPDDPC